jgi:O-antigen ligase
MTLKYKISQELRLAGEVAFGLFIVLSLITPSWRYGPFTWLPLWGYEDLAGGPMEVGIANFLPVLAIACALASRLLARRPWTLGPMALVVPLLGLTIVGLLHVDLGNFRLAFLHVGMFGLAWFVYLYVINERPRLAWSLALVLLVQGAVAAGQFFTQRDLGLVFLGELPLHPAHEGNSVLWARGQPWLRAYGLTAHPNLLGALSAALLLLLLPALTRNRGAARTGRIISALVGAIGLFLSFSRAGWLMLATGLMAWWALNRLTGRPRPGGRTSASGAGRLRWLLAIIPLAVLLFFYRDLIFSRFFSLDTPIEAQSIDQRLHDAALAVEIIRDEPLFGVGLGYYIDAAQRLDPDAARVHNVALLATAELGLLGLLFWLWIMLSPFWLLLRGRMSSEIGGRDFGYVHPAAQVAPWVAMLVANTFDTMLWLSSNWQTSILFALLLANLVRLVTVVELAAEADQRPASAPVTANMSRKSATRS